MQQKKWKDKKQQKKEEAEKRQNKKGEDLSAEFLADLKKSGVYCEMQKVDFIPTGCLTLNKIIGDGSQTNKAGGFPRGYITELFGAESSGKSTIAAHAAKVVLSKGERVVWADFEHSFQLQIPYYQKIGLNVKDSNLFVITPKNFEDGVLRIGQSLFKLNPPPALIIIDSVTAMMPKANVEADAGETVQIGLHAKLFGTFMNYITKYLDEKKTALLLLNQLRVDITMSSMPGRHGGPKMISSGGNATKFFAAVRIQLLPDSFHDEETTGTNAITGETGQKKLYSGAIKAICVKNKYDLPYKSGPVYMTVGKGIDNIMSLVILGENTKIIKTATAGWLSWEDPNKQHSFKIQGRVNLVKHLEQNPEALKALMPYLNPSESNDAKFMRKVELEEKGVENLEASEKKELKKLQEQLKDYKPDESPMDGEVEVEAETPSPKDEAALSELNEMLSVKEEDTNVGIRDKEEKK
jgi:recombination protein RecA